jgi:hypothetical protein
VLSRLRARRRQADAHQADQTPRGRRWADRHLRRADRRADAAASPRNRDRLGCRVVSGRASDRVRPLGLEAGLHDPPGRHRQAARVHRRRRRDRKARLAAEAGARHQGRLAQSDHDVRALPTRHR